MTPKRSALTLLVFALMTAGCAGGGDSVVGSSEPEPREFESTLVFPVQGPRNSVMEALWEGVVTRNGDCLQLGEKDTIDPATPVWPPGFTYEERGDEVVIFDDTGAEVARTNEEVKMGGGLVGEAGAPIPKDLKKIVKGCPAPYWIVGEMG